MGRSRRLASCLAMVAGLGAAVSPLQAATCPELKRASHRSQIYGQLLMSGFIGSRPSTAAVKRLRSAIRNGEAGGAIFYSRNVVNPKQLKKLTQALSPHDALFLPFLAVDEEGGRVQRLTRRKGFSWQTRAHNIPRRGPRTARRTYAQMAREIVKAGLNFNLAPVVDVNINRSNPVIGLNGRAFSEKPHVVSFYARKFVEEHRRKGVLTALKHFPGHGSSRRDSHRHLTDVTKTWKPVELLPYRSLIENGLADGVMTAHVVNRLGWHHVRNRIEQPLPASLSPHAVDVLRHQLKFDGMVLTDDLQMRGISRKFNLKDAIVKALQAGNDLVLIGNILDYQSNVSRFFIRTVTDAVDEGTLSHQRLEKSFCRIMKAKRWLSDFESRREANSN